MDCRKARVIAFYLPQFHPIPENDEWWGKGFTEWTNVAKAKPLFRWHYQPHIPADLGFYDLRIPEVREAQAAMARQYGIEGFCYYHYWFGNGRRLLERPFNEVLRSGKPDFPFCLAWANASWTGIWYGAPHRTLIEQVYPGEDDYRNHFYSILDALHDKRYMTVNGKKIFIIYDPLSFKDIQRFTQLWRELAAKEGLPGIHFIAHLIKKDPERYGCDSCLANAPFLAAESSINKIKALVLRRLFNTRMLSVLSYPRFVDYMKNFELSPKEYPLLIHAWDNTPRSHKKGFVLKHSTPALFGRMLENSIKKVTSQYQPEERLIFIKAWNEWAEGNHLEPDLKYGHAYLQEIGKLILS